MASINKQTKTVAVYTHEGAVAQKVSKKEELARTVMTCMLWENSFYEDGVTVSDRIKSLVKECSQEYVSELAIKTREEMQLRHASLLLVREMARKGGSIVSETLARVIQRPDELTEFLAIYWKEGKCPLSAQVKLGLAKAFTKFNEYQLGKYNRCDNGIKLQDVLFLCHAKPLDKEQEAVWKRLINGTLATPDTWEVALSSGANKKETFERLLTEKKLGGLAVLRNLRNMIGSGVDTKLIKERLEHGISRALPFRFVTAARYAPTIEDAIERAMFKGLEGIEQLPGKTCLLVDVSGSMDDTLSRSSETKRLDAANGLAILLRECCEDFYCATFSSKVVHVAPRRGFSLSDAIKESQPHSSTQLKSALTTLKFDSNEWAKADRIIVITDEQSQDGILPAWSEKAYVINVAGYKNGLSYGNGWTHINGWSERIVEYIATIEK